MKKVFTSTLLTLTAVPFLMAAPAAKKVQNQSTSSNQTTSQTTTTKKTHKSHAKKSTKATGTDTAAPSTAQPKK